MIEVYYGNFVYLDEFLYICLNFSQPMKWSDEHDISFLKELVNFRPWNCREG